MMRIAAALAIAGVVIAGHAQAAPAKARPAGGHATQAAVAYHAARGPDRVHPDLNGVWQVMNTAGWNIEPHAASAALQMRPGPYGPVPAKDVLALGAVGAVPAGLGVVQGGEIPYTADARKTRDANKADWINKDPEIKCYLPGVPRANYMTHPFQIFQSEKQMLFAYEYAGAVRNILFTDPGPAPVDSWMGQSVAHWEGDTLVVVVTGLNDSTWLDRAGNFHSSDMKVVERYTPTGPGILRYEAEITDPATFTRPWKMSMNLYRHVGDDARLGQFKCVEFVEELMYGKLRKNPLP
ncbi:hypothetical protein [Phenylobacterium sp.]|uniref:hypothetical protein n=1 Tax=Phenylobacterium sp. TaxID=1871053 RepID=UPI002DED5FAD|nr:hypothetical protein [Phenylobacterium sp.]